MVVPRKNILICIDRDGTIIYDKKYHLGHQKNWKSKVKVLRNVVKGLKELRKIPNVKIYAITNQPGVAIKDFPLLTIEKAGEVCQYVLNKLKEKGVELDGCEICPYANPVYVKKRKEFKFIKKMVGNYSCIKPKPGMIYNIMKKQGFKKRNTNIYVIGDRASDVKTGLNANGYGILVPFVNRAGENKKVRELKTKLKSNKIYIAKDFLDAVEFIRCLHPDY